MRQLLIYALNQIKNSTLDSQTIININKFLKSVNDLLGGQTDQYFIYIDQYNTLNINILDYEFIRVSPMTAKLILNQYITTFKDSPLLFDILLLLSDCHLFKVSPKVQLYLFNKVFNSGFICYVPIDKKDFIKSYDFIKLDLSIISDIVSQLNLRTIDRDLKETLKDLYLLDGLSLKDCLD